MKELDWAFPLCISYIELFGGYVKVKSEKKQGASFYIFLPRQV